MTKKSGLSLGGVFPPIPTPFKPNGDIDLAHLSSNIERWNEEPLAGYVVGGSTGEFPYQTPDERVRVLRAVVQKAAKGRLLIAGCGMESTRGTVELAKRMAQAGAHAALVVTPTYYKGEIGGPLFERHYEQVADASPIPVILYTVPVNTGVDIPAETVCRLAAHPNIVGIKDSGATAEKLAQMVAGSPAGFQVVTGSASRLLEALSVGAVGTVSALANLAGARHYELMQYFRRGDLEEARSMQARLATLNTVVMTQLGGIPAIKAALDMLGYYGGPVRSPLSDLNADKRETLRKALVEGGLL